MDDLIRCDKMYIVRVIYFVSAICSLISTIGSMEIVMLSTQFQNGMIVFYNRTKQDHCMVSLKYISICKWVIVMTTFIYSLVPDF